MFTDLADHLTEAFGDLRPEIAAGRIETKPATMLVVGWGPVATPEQREEAWLEAREARLALLERRSTKVEKVARACGHCGVIFTPRARSRVQKYCTPRCERARHRERQRAARF